MFRAARSVLSLFILIGALTVLWEVVKLLGGDPSEAWTPPFQWTVASDLNMPHVWDIAASFVEPAQRNGPPLGVVLVKAGILPGSSGITALPCRVHLLMTNGMLVPVRKSGRYAACWVQCCP